MGSKKLKILVLVIILCIISIVVIITNGNTYLIKTKVLYGIDNAEQLNIKIEDENVIKCVDKKIENGNLEIKIEAVSKGRTFIDIYDSDDESCTSFIVYVHSFNVITFNEFLGDSTGSIIIPISIIILLTYILFLLIKSYRKSVKNNLYQYKNIAYLGIIIFGIFIIITQMFSLSNYRGLINTINGVLNLFSFPIGLLPVTIVVSILVILSNISLIRKEGFNIKNILGIIFGLFLCFSSELPDLMYRLLFTAKWIDIHNQQGIGLYIYNLFESIISIIVTYIECVLIGTIIIGVKSAKHIPKYDKDFIIILGCKLKKDGTLTNLLRGRVDKAIEFSKKQKEEEGKGITFIPSGGKGQDEVVSEAQAMKNYLIEQGIKEDRIIIEDKSKNTFENIKFSNNIIKERLDNAKTAFSTTNYHVYRAGNIATTQGLNYEGIGAKTKSYFWINAFIREFIATLYTEKKKHILAICSILAFITLAIFLTYINNMI